MDFASIVAKLPKSLWESLDHYTKFAYLKTFIPAWDDARYGMALRALHAYLEDICA